ncbi:MAG: DinB family protein [Chitinophagaceae bacterium]|nr:MAG: DinB family protein [Chitinophagaceae bacterium]
MTNTNVKRYIAQIQQLYYGQSWLDEDFEKKLKLLNEETAFIRPGGYIHSVAEVVSHIVEWRKDLIERFRSGNRNTLKMDSPLNWRDNESLRLDGWAMLMESLSKSQIELVKLLEQKDDDFLNRKWRDDDTYDWLIAGLIQHDAYHLGQIGLIYKMMIKDHGPA